MTDAAKEAEELKLRQMKYNRSAKPKLPVEAARRQGTITRLALETLGTKEEAMAYLNVERAQLKGRPIDLATATAEGFRLVEQDLSAIGGAEADLQRSR